MGAPPSRRPIHHHQPGDARKFARIGGNEGCACAPCLRRWDADTPMRYPLPYAFARGNQLLLEDDGSQMVLWHAAAPSPSALSEVVRKFRVRG